MKRRLCILALVVITALSLPGILMGCSRAMASTDLMEDIQATAPQISDGPDDHTAEALTGFGLDLLQSMPRNTNVLISPLSAEYALAMTANGAAGNTLSQIESTIGLSREELNAALSSLYFSTKSAAGDFSSDTDDGSPGNANDAVGNPSEDPATDQLFLANAIWFKEGVTVNRTFLQTNANWFDASLFQAPFDESTEHDINTWVGDHTDHMIQNLVDGMSPDAFMYLINASAFDATWAVPYEHSQVEEKTFTAENGDEYRVDFMNGTEDTYLKNDLCTGFAKSYEGFRYDFVALLPREDLSVDDLVRDLDGASLHRLLQGADGTYLVRTSLPKFMDEYDIDMAEALATLGMDDAFDEELADFTGIAPRGESGENAYISRVLHKTSIIVDEEGTQVRAATAVEMADTTAALEDAEVVSVTLDRPFVYLLIDHDSQVPIFMGIVRTF